MSTELKLYELPSQVVMCKNLLEDEELSKEEYDELVTMLVETIDEEASYYLKMITMDGLTISNLKEEKKRLAALQGMLEKRKERKEQFIKDVMIKANLKKLETSHGKFSFRKSESIEIKDIHSIPDEFLQITVDKKPVKSDIKKYMKENGVTEIEGAKLITKNNLQVK